MDEIKELYVEEVALLRRIQKYGKERSRGELDRLEKVISLLLYRIYTNLFSAMLLTVEAHKKQKTSFFLLPCGVLLRCAFTDCLIALYLQRVEENRANEELGLRAIEYANSLLERKEVYRDQVKSAGDDLEDDFIDHCWELTMEDNFLHLLTFDKNKKGLEVTKRSKKQLEEAGFSTQRSVGTKEQKDFLITQNGLETVATRLYHYYKYFSQYEHFSENGQGDVLALSDKNGNGNIHWPSAIKALSDGVEKVMMKSSRSV